MGAPARAPRAAGLGIDGPPPAAMLSRWASRARGARLAAGRFAAARSSTAGRRGATSYIPTSLLRLTASFLHSPTSTSTIPPPASTLKDLARLSAAVSKPDWPCPYPRCGVDPE
jgi:hypothetical protein